MDSRSSDVPFQLTETQRVVRVLSWVSRHAILPLWIGSFLSGFSLRTYEAQHDFDFGQNTCVFGKKSLHSMRMHSEGGDPAAWRISSLSHWFRFTGLSRRVTGHMPAGWCK
jgi:hypothetical protein